MNKIRGLIQLIRPINCVMMGFAVFVGVILAHPVFLSSLLVNIIFGFNTGFLLTAAAMTINDYYDRKIDAVNEPSRPIPMGLVSTNEALILFFSVSVAGFIF
ncbi:UbiA family prenyltransferase, partial [Candidatus Bathyarchaeota archaeon]|nr:UbiA family prenyltransferase [Candidatus Bathyarchaeota archaeon]